MSDKVVCKGDAHIRRDQDTTVWQLKKKNLFPDDWGVKIISDT